MMFSVMFTVAIIAARLPGSLHHGALAACRPTTLEAAEGCLTRAISKEDLAVLVDKSKSQAFRGALDCQIETEWRLGDPSSPMAKAMQEKIGIDNPAVAAGTIIQDVQARAAGSGIDWSKARDAASRIPQGAHPTTCPRPIQSERRNAN